MDSARRPPPRTTKPSAQACTDPVPRSGRITSRITVIADRGTSRDNRASTAARTTSGSGSPRLPTNTELLQQPRSTDRGCFRFEAWAPADRADACRISPDVEPSAALRPEETGNLGQPKEITQPIQLPRAGRSARRGHKLGSGHPAVGEVESDLRRVLSFVEA